MKKEKKHFKLIENSALEHEGRTLYRIKAVKSIPTQGVCKGDIGGYVESLDNLSGDAWVWGNAEVCGDAEVCGKAKISGSAVVRKGHVSQPSDVITVQVPEQYPITITRQYITIGCQCHTKKAWFNFTEKEIYAMDGNKAVAW